VSRSKTYRLLPCLLWYVRPTFALGARYQREPPALPEHAPFERSMSWLYELRMCASMTSMSNRSRPRRPGTPLMYVPVRCIRRACREMRRRRQHEPASEKQEIVPARPSQATRASAMLAGSNTGIAGRLHGRAGTVSRSDGLVLPSPSHLTARAASAANVNVRTGSARTPRATTIRHRGQSSAQARFLKAETSKFRMIFSPVARLADSVCRARKLDGHVIGEQ